MNSDPDLALNIRDIATPSLSLHRNYVNEPNHVVSVTQGGRRVVELLKSNPQQYCKPLKVWDVLACSSLEARKITY